ncbi:MAG: trypsin-like peptidase domain-containing protein [Phycisphaerales bacterium]
MAMGAWIVSGRAPGLGPRAWIGLALCALCLASGPALAQRSSDPEFLERLRGAVFQIEVYGADGEKASSGTGFLAERERLAITNFHVIDGAASLRLVFNDGHEVTAAELWQAYPQWDLAVLRLPDSFAQRADVPKPLTITIDTPFEGTPVLTAGFPMGYGYTLTQGIASGIRVQRDLPLGELDAYDPETVWIQTDAAMNPGNSGGPLIDRDGQVVGVNTQRHQSLGGVRLDGFYFAVAAQHVARALAQLPDQPVGLGVVRQPRAIQRPVPMVFPSVQTPGNTHPLAVVRDARTAAQSLRCRHCLGDGTRTQLVRGRTQRGGQAWQTGHERERRCASCEGLGVDPESPPALFVRLARSAAMVDRTHERFGELGPLVEQHFEDAWTVPSLASRDRFRRATRGIAIGDRQRRPGAPTALAVFGVRPLPLQGASDVLVGLQADGSPVVFTSPTLVLPDTVGSGYRWLEYGLAGGIFAGTVNLPDTGPVPVVQHAFVIGPP